MLAAMRNGQQEMTTDQRQMRLCSLLRSLYLWANAHFVVLSKSQNALKWQHFSAAAFSLL